MHRSPRKPALPTLLTLALSGAFLPAAGCARTSLDAGPAPSDDDPPAHEEAGAGEDGPGGSVADIEGVEWRLERLGEEEPPPGVVITATFADGAVSGSSGCNRFSGGYTTGEDPRLSMHGPFAGTKRACQPPAGEWENRFRAAFESATGFELSEGGLLLWAADGTELLFARPAPGS